jgi:hypothetical protein
MVAYVTFIKERANNKGELETRFGKRRRYQNL